MAGSRSRTTKLKLEYDGGGFSGWSRQPGRRTVQGVLEQALATVLDQPVSVTVAGRTDTGVHALGQVASHLGEPAPQHSLNGVLPEDIRVLESRLAPGGFDARRDARGRTYRYRVLARNVGSPLERGRSLHWRYPLDRERLAAHAALLPGRHDFTAFTPTQTGHRWFEREVARAEWTFVDDQLEFWIEADAFLRQMVRILVGTMLAEAAGRRTGPDLGQLLEGRPRHDAGDTAGPHGLYLEAVHY